MGVSLRELAARLDAQQPIIPGPSSSGGFTVSGTGHPGRFQLQGGSWGSNATLTLRVSNGVGSFRTSLNFQTDAQGNINQLFDLGPNAPSDLFFAITDGTVNITDFTGLLWHNLNR